MHSLDWAMGFVAAAALLTITPGIDTATVLRSAMIGGVRAGAAAAFGIALGCVMWGGSVSVGLGVLLLASDLAFSLVRLAGTAYLLWIGVGLLWASPSQLHLDARDEPSDRSAVAALRRGLLTNLLNPKVGVFYLTFLPQFVPRGGNVATHSFVLACIHVALNFLWFGILIAATVPLGRWLRRPRNVRIVNCVTGGVLVAFGLKLALARRG